jgi:two-component system, OmpR family, phosphate regulon sensor histidine kinase PhoR
MIRPAYQEQPVSAPAQEILFKIINSTRDSVIIIDTQLRVVAASDAAYESFGRGREKLEGRRLSELVRDAALHDGYRWTVERREPSDLRLENSARIFDVHIAPLEIDGSPLAIGFFYDVTQMERLESIRQEFLSNISHELRTPLTSILAFVETLEDGAIDDIENNRRFLGVIRRNAERMRCLISDILELSMIESGRVAIEVRPVDLEAIVGAVFSDLSVKAEARSIDLKNEVPDGTQVNADPVRLEQMLTNLIENAIKFNREGGGVTVTHRRSGARDLISVNDSGEGILPEHIDRVFERFYRADRARTSDVGGTGLGLAIVKHLARLHGGEVSGRSQLGIGSTFTIELPSA